MSTQNENKVEAPQGHVKELIDKFEDMTLHDDKEVDDTGLDVEKEVENEKKEEHKSPIATKPVRRAVKIEEEKKKGLTPFPYQVPHINKMKKILQEFGFAFDMTALGDGKTYIAVLLAIQLGLELVVVADELLQTKWSNLAEEAGIKITLLTYGKLRSTPPKDKRSRTVVLKHGLLSRTDRYGNKGHESVTFELTDKAEKMFQKGVLLAFDESHRLKNLSDQTEAAIALCRGITEAKSTKSGILFISATPNDKDKMGDSTEAFCRLCGIITEKWGYTKDREYHQVGIKQLMEYCRELDPELTKEIEEEQHISVNTVKSVAFNLFTEVLFPRISSKALNERKYKHHVYNYFASWTLDKEERSLLRPAAIELFEEELPKDERDYKLALNELSTLIVFNDKTGKAEAKGAKKKENMAKITKILGHLESNKINLIAKFVVCQLEKNPKAKAVIGVKLLESVDRLCTLLSRFKPAVITGEVSAKASKKKISDREKERRIFMEDKSCRVMVCTAGTGGIGIDLNDDTGEKEIFSVGVPDYNAIMWTQFNGRIYRVTNKSDATSYLFYGKSDTKESRILDSLNSKGDVIKKMRGGDDGDTTMKLLCDFVDKVQGEDKI